MDVAPVRGVWVVFHMGGESVGVWGIAGELTCTFHEHSATATIAQEGRLLTTDGGTPRIELMIGVR